MYNYWLAAFDMSGQEIISGHEQVLASQLPGTSAPLPEVSQATPVRRGPGRPKGSGKKQQQDSQSDPPKIKRPVGRPRKDGLPAGSLSPPKSKRGPGRPRKSEIAEARSKEMRQSTSGSAQQPEVAIGASTSVVPTVSIHF